MSQSRHGQIERQPADQRGPIGLRRRLQSFLFEPGQDERIDRIDYPAIVLDLWRRRLLRLDEGPMRRILGPLRDPLFQQRNLLRLKAIPRLFRRHAFLVLGRDAVDHLARVGFARHDDLALGRRLARIETHAAFLQCRPVAFEAPIGQNGPNVALKIDGVLPLGKSDIRAGVTAQKRE